MPNLEDARRAAQSAMCTAAQTAQDAAAAAGEKAGALKGYAAEKASALKDSVAEKAGVLMDHVGGKAGALKESAAAGVSLMSEKRDLEKSYQALGEWYAAHCGDDAPEAVADVVRAIRASQAKIAELRARGETEE